jgi:multiple sugar transport system substrate-binding protein
LGYRPKVTPTKISGRADRCGPHRAIFLLFSLVVWLAACDTNSEPKHASEYVEVEVWMHAGSETEGRTIQDQVLRYNASQYRYRVNAVILPAETYNAHVRAAATSGQLPDMLEFDAPYLYEFIDQGLLLPIDKLLTDDIRVDLWPALIEQGMVDGRMYAISTTDTGLAIYARRSKLREAGIRVPSGIRNAWSASEFDALLKRLTRDDSDGAVIDFKLNRGGEWLTYAFAPMLQSAGAELTSPEDGVAANVALNGANAVKAIRRLQSWQQHGFIDANLDDSAFVSGRVALSWAGNSEYQRYAQAWGDDLVILPLPDFGTGSPTVHGAWLWGISSHCRNVRAAMHFLEYLFRPEEVLIMAQASGGVPARQSIISQSFLYRHGGGLQMFTDQLQEGMRPRPKIAAYTTVSAEFQRALSEILNGQDVQGALDAAAVRIDRSLHQRHDIR